MTISFNTVSNNTRPLLTSDNVYLAEDSEADQRPVYRSPGSPVNNYKQANHADSAQKSMDLVSDAECSLVTKNADTIRQDSHNPWKTSSEDLHYAASGADHKGSCRSRSSSGGKEETVTSLLSSAERRGADSMFDQDSPRSRYMSIDDEEMVVSEGRTAKSATGRKRRGSGDEGTEIYNVDTFLFHTCQVGEVQKREISLFASWKRGRFCAKPFPDI